MFQYAFCCNEEEEVTRISTLIHVDDGKVHIVNIRYVCFHIQLALLILVWMFSSVLWSIYIELVYRERNAAAMWGKKHVRSK